MRIKPIERRQKNVCVISRCSSEGAFILGRDTSFLDIDEDLDVCQKHWEAICDEGDQVIADRIFTFTKKCNPVPKKVA